MTDKLNDWFAGNADALDLYDRLVFIAHTWDDMIDRDNAIRETTVNSLMCNLLIHLPANAFYRKFETEIRTLVFCGAVSYLAANEMERSGDEHQVELAHYLRYAVSQIAVFMIAVLNGMDKAPMIIARAMPVMIPERVSDYVTEHKNP